MVLIEV